MAGDLSVHGTALAFPQAAGKGMLLTGPSGCGKSTLAIDLMQMGAGLIVDDLVILRREGDQVILSAPENAASAIAVRGLGIMNAPLCPPAPLTLVVDLGQTSQDILPSDRKASFHGISVPLLHRIAGPSFAAVLLHYILYGSWKA